MVSQDEIAKKFSRGGKRGKASNLFIEGRVIYSYGRHFPIALRLDDGFLFNTSKYSLTTTKHQNKVRGVLSGKVLEVDTKEIKQAIRDEVETIDEFYISRL